MLSLTAKIWVLIHLFLWMSETAFVLFWKYEILKGSIPHIQHPFYWYHKHVGHENLSFCLVEGLTLNAFSKKNKSALGFFKKISLVFKILPRIFGVTNIPQSLIFSSLGCHSTVSLLVFKRIQKTSEKWKLNAEYSDHIKICICVWLHRVVKIDGLFADERQLNLFFWHTFPGYFCKARWRERCNSHFGEIS